MTATVETIHGAPHFVIHGYSGVVWTSGPISLNPKHPATKMEMDWVNLHTGVSYGDLYDALRAAMKRKSVA